MSKYVIITGLYDTMDLYSAEIKYVLTKLGHKVIELHMDTMDKDLKSLLIEEGNGHIEAVITFNNLGYNMGYEQGQSLWDSMDVTYVNILMDHPFHYDEPLKNAPKSSHVFCIDRNHVKFIRRFYPNIEKVDFLPHAACLHTLEGDLEIGQSFGAAREIIAGQELASFESGSLESDTLESGSSARSIDILYAGNLSRVLIEQLIPDFTQYPEIDGVVLSQNCLNRLITNPSQTTEAVIEDELKQMLSSGDALSVEKLTDETLLKYIVAFRFLDGFATSFYREQAVRILVENGFRVHVLGVGWEQCDWADNENLIHLGKVNAAEVLQYMKQSKIVLNTLTWFKDGTHDRIYNGMLCGAAVVSDSSVYLKESLTASTQQNIESQGLSKDTGQGAPIQMFDLKDIGRLPYIMHNLLTDDSARQALAAAGRQHALDCETWDVRVPQLLDLISK